MARPVIFCLLVGLAGCGSTIGTLDSLPDGPDVSAAPWPRLVDTPEPPEERLTAGTGERAIERLGARRSESDARLARAEAVEPVSDALLARGETNVSRVGEPGNAVDEAALLARGERLRQRREANAASLPPSIDAPLRRPVPLRPLDTPVVSSGFEERARQAQERAARAGG